jgi:hypothetical protein
LRRERKGFGVPPPLSARQLKSLAGTPGSSRVTVPGAGVVYATAGRYVIVTGAGEVLAFSGLDVPPGDELCAALSP